MTSTELKRRSLCGYPTAGKAIESATRLGNVAFTTEDGRHLTCTRDHVDARINGGQRIEVLADCTPECPLCGNTENLETDKSLADYSCERCEHVWRI